MLDASFIKAWSTRDLIDNQTGYSDADARVGRAGRTFDLGYKLHLSIDSVTMLPLSCFFAFGESEREETLTNNTGEGKAGSAEFWSQTQERDSGQPVQRQQNQNGG